jgi:hypothetical protein
MLMNLNNANWLKADTSTCSIYSDVSVFTNAASTIKRLTVESQGSGGTPYLTLKARNTTQASLFLTNGAFTVASETANIPTNFTVNNAGTTNTPLQLYGNGVVNIGNGVANNKVLVLLDGGSSDTPATATNFNGFGINSATLRYQAQSTATSHKFFCGATQAYTITSSGGTNGSDIRWKKEVQDITDALSKIQKLQGKTFLMNDCPDRVMGFIAQEVKETVPEVVWIDKSEPEEYHFMQYDRLTALLCEGIKELVARVKTLEATVNTLKGNPV